MIEAEFWVKLEYRLCAEFAGLPEQRYRYIWCDDLTPIGYLFDETPPRITGRATICNGPRQVAWDFSLSLPPNVSDRDTIPWASLLPPENMTRWMSFDEHAQRIEIDPAAATPDLA